MSERRAYRVSGRVQGVGFRWWARETATHLGLRGTVRNAADGTVHVEAWGAPEALERFESALREGPPGALVRRLEAMDPGAHELPRGFSITR